jgi:hypothetical protein
MNTVVNVDITSPDSAYLISLTGAICEQAVALLMEDKNELGDGGCDPSMQVGLSIVRLVQYEVDNFYFSFYGRPL